MPGIADRRALTQAIYDSLVLTPATAARLRSRGVKDVKKAMRLREYELDLVKRSAPTLYSELDRSVTLALQNGNAGNHYVYVFQELFCRLMYDKQFVSENQTDEVRSKINLMGKLMEIKMPTGYGRYGHDHAPEGIGKAHARYIMLRSVMGKIASCWGDAGRNRGKLQHLNVSHKDNYAFDLATGAWEEEHMKPKKKDHRVKKKDRDELCHCSSTVRLGSQWKMVMLRVNDLTYLRISSATEGIRLLLTHLHYSRIMDALKRLSNIDLGLTVSYGMEDADLGLEVPKAAIAMVRQMSRMGIKNDLWPGEAGKAVTDLYKAVLSQTEELPWDNKRMLLKTYDDKRQDNAEILYERFIDNRFDVDIMMNLTYVWKTCPQPDSDIRKDFHDMYEGVCAPNKISDDAARLMELSFRRAFLVGLLREGRIPLWTEVEGKTIHPVLKAVLAKNSPNESDIRRITFDMMGDIVVKSRDVFPSVHDVSHLGFKDKSSSVTGKKIREQVEAMEDMELQIITLEDRILKTALDAKVDDLLSELKHDHEFPAVEKIITATANDILTSLDEDVGVIFREAEVKYRTIVKSLNEISNHYGEGNFAQMLHDWARENKELLINTGTEPKLGEVHKKTVRIFFMFEKGMKTFLSQFERMSRIMDYYIKGAEIVKGDRAREKHMNVLSSAHKSTRSGILAYQILFDLSKFSQKFNHRIIDAAAKVIGEATDYPHYAAISSLFKASYLYVSARFIDASHTGVLGAFEGFLNFLWTGIHANVMDLALRGCGRSGDLAAYSDDGLLMFTMRSTLEDTKATIHKELDEVIGSIIKTYKDFGLDFNLGKTLISRRVAEFLGVIQYDGKRLATWMKELCKLGIADETVTIKSLAQEITDTASQLSALVKAGMSPYAACYVGYLELLEGPCRRVHNSIKEIIREKPELDKRGIIDASILSFLCLSSSFGGVRIQDPLTMMITSDYDPISEMIYEIERLIEIMPQAGGITNLIIDGIVATNDYLPILMGASPVHTEGLSYDSSRVRNLVLTKLRNKFPFIMEHPLSREKAPRLHEVLEGFENLSVPIVASMARYIVPMVEYSKVMAPTKSSSLAKLLYRGQIRSIQAADTRAMKASVTRILVALSSGVQRPLPTALELYQRSFPALNFAPPIPSYRKLGKVSDVYSEYHYEFKLLDMQKNENASTSRLENNIYTDDLTPPLITSDVNLKHLTSAPDIPTHCMRALFSEVVSNASNGHNVLDFANVICEINGTPSVPTDLLATMKNIRKLSVANRKKATHRVYWSNATRAAGVLSRSGQLNTLMTIVGEMHYSMIITVAVALTHLRFKMTDCKRYPELFYIDIDPELAISTRYTISMSSKFQPVPIQEPNRRMHSKQVVSVFEAVRSETRRTVESLRAELTDQLVIGRMCMLPSFRKHDPSSFVVDPIKFSMVWTLIGKMDSVVRQAVGSVGVSQMRLESRSLDQLPVDLANMAIIYRAWKYVLKSEINKWRKCKIKDCPMHEEIADETLHAARELHVIHTVTKEYLLSKDAALTYLSLLRAEDYDVIYYGLDECNETIHSGVVSNPRAKAAGRVIDKIVADGFESKEYDPQSDSERFLLMIFERCVRGSTHRVEPYNQTVVQSWVKYFINFVSKVVELIPPKFKVKTWSEHWGKWIYPRMSEDESAFVVTLRNDYVQYLPRLGTRESQMPAYLFVRNTVQWGTVIPMHEVLISKSAHDWYCTLHKNVVMPVMAFIRTVTYTTLENGLKGKDRSLLHSDTVERVNKVEQLMEELAKPKIDIMGNKHYLTTRALITTTALVRYRDVGGDTISHDITVAMRSGEGDEITSLALMMYSLALPALIASGRSSISKVMDMSSYGTEGRNALIQMAINNYSLPVREDSASVPFYLFYGMGEHDLRRALVNTISFSNSDLLVCVEIPPQASVVSVGIVKWLTKSKYSVVMSGLSSDKRGMSMYVVSLGTFVFPNETSTRAVVTTPIVPIDFGYESLLPIINRINEGQIEHLVSLILTPMHQAGLPASMRVHDGEKELTYKVAEELVDRASVSFIETGRPSDSLIALAQSNPLKSAYLHKALLYKLSVKDHYIAGLIASSYYYCSVFPRLDPQNVLEKFLDLMELARDVHEGVHIFKILMDPLNSISGIDPSSITPKAQIMSKDLPILQLDEFEYDLLYDSHALPILRLSGHSLVERELRGIVTDFFRTKGADFDVPDLYDLVKMPEKLRGKKKVKAGNFVLTLPEGDPSPYGLMNMINEPYRVIDHREVEDSHTYLGEGVMPAYQEAMYDEQPEVGESSSNPKAMSKPTDLEFELVERLDECGFSDKLDWIMDMITPEDYVAFLNLEEEEFIYHVGALVGDIVADELEEAGVETGFEGF